VTATSGSVFVVGALLLVAGLVLAAARRRWLPRA
jgi:MYXO-CTERM domain-containing protein